jgi:TonB family protein
VRWTEVGSSLLLHALVVGALVLAGALVRPRGAARAEIVELAIVPTAAPAPSLPPPRPDPAPSASGLLDSDDGDHASLGGGSRGGDLHPEGRRRAPAPLVARTPLPAAIAESESGLEVPHAGNTIAEPDVVFVPGAGVGPGAGAGEGHLAGDGRGAGRASRRWPRPLDPPDHTRLPYPRRALEFQVSGTVKLLLTVGADGRVRDVVVTEKLGYGFDQIAVDEARKLRFAPGLDYDGRPIAMHVKWNYSFEPP